MARSSTGIAYAFLYAVILGGLVFTVFVTIPAWSAWQATRQVLTERIAAHEERTRFVQNVDTRLQELQTYAADARVLSVSFPDGEAPADALGVLGALASRSGVTARVVHGPELQKNAPTPAPAADGGAGETAALARSAARGPVYELKVQVRATYAGLSAFIRDLEKSIRFFDVISMDVKGGLEGGLVEADIVVHTYGVETGGTLLPSVSSTPASTATPSPTP